ncbi:MAG: glycogen debranching protein GlgX [Paracoccaceae bacterium]|nr:glycogen debranching protein GlgX [Paracoccaceae bacterium]
MTLPGSLGPGRAHPLGTTPDDGGVNFAVFSENATKVELCVFDRGGRETRFDLPERDGDVWHGHLEGAKPGLRYGYRAHGPWAPAEGHRFNPAKLLLDPYARAITGHPRWAPELMGHRAGDPDADLALDPRDSAPFMAKGIVVAPFETPAPAGPGTPVDESVIYEAHVKGLTWRHPAAAPKGTFLGLASEPMLEHLTRLGVTAVELLPIHAFMTDGFLVERGLANYWGYQTLNFFTPDPRYLHDDDIGEFRTMVARLHAAGIEVILDVVYNHSCEGNEHGPTLSFRGLDNASYYRLAPDRRHYVNDTGTGNTLRLDHPMVLRMVVDSLRYWAGEMGVDGFRFDLAATLGRRDSGFDPTAPFFQALRQDPLLAGRKLIAEPWDIGPGGYQLGGFPPPFLEWNDRYRDGVRRFWRGDHGSAADLAARITGSAGEFDGSGRAATSSVNLLTAHDGFSLRDVVSYARKHNEANGEGNRDGHSENYSENLGVEGPTDDPKILEARARRARAMLATLLLSQGTPMLLAGDEIGHSQNGNNNAYAQDNETSWLDWEAADHALLAFVRRLVAFRKAHPVLRQKRFLHSRARTEDRKEDLFWHHASGRPMEPADWTDPKLGIVIAEVRMASGTPAYAAREEAVLLIFNAGTGTEVMLPPPPAGWAWTLGLDSADPDRAGTCGPRVRVAEQSVLALVLERKP